MVLLRFLVVLSIWYLCDAARILVIQPTPAKGHVIAMEPFFVELAARGHEVTFITSFPHNPPVPNLREFDMSHIFPPLVSNLSFQETKKSLPNPFQTPIAMSRIELEFCESIYSDKKMAYLLESNDTYDVVITEIFTADCFVPFAHKFKAPLISFVTSSALPWVADRSGLPDNPSYIPNYFVDLSSQMSLSDRLYNTIVLYYNKLIFYFYALPRSQRLVNYYFGNSSIPPINEMIKETSLVLVNSYFALSESRPFPPNIIEVGGIHIRPAKKLPKDLKSLLDRSTQGVVVVSFGSMIRVSSIPEPTINMFLEAFSKIPQTVIFKYEEDLSHLPPNVIIRKWLPQRDVIEHDNVKAVLAHGGLASTIECVYFGKPLVGIPFHSDQSLNVRAVVKKGAGLTLDLEQLSAEKIEVALKTVINDPGYTENARRLSREYRDRPMTALQTAVFWTEYVIRHRGAHHLRPASTSMPWYQLALLDVAAVLLLPLIPFFYLIYFLFFRAVEVSPNDFRNYEKKKSEKKAE